MKVHQLVNHEAIRQALQSVELPDRQESSCLDVVTGFRLSGKVLELELTFAHPCRSTWLDLEQRLKACLQPFAPQIDVKCGWQAPAVVANSQIKSIAGVKNIIAIASGKGGVGKSTTSVNLALALVQEGAKVGMLDADIYGPSQALMLGVRDQRPEMESANLMRPIKGIGGVEMISMGNLVTENTPMVWRGPMVSGALQQLLNQTHWGDLDYLIVDMPPGTGDIQLTLSQSVPVSASVVVTTPQDIALLDARKGIEMFHKVNVPVLGIVENMSLFHCPNCHHEEPIFGTAGGDKLAEEYQVGVLGRLPLLRSVCEMTDRGAPPVYSEPESDIANAYRSIARKMTANLAYGHAQKPTTPTFQVSDD